MEYFGVSGGEQTSYFASCAWRAGQAYQRLPVISLISYKVCAKVQNTVISKRFHVELKVVEIHEETIGSQTGQKLITLTKCVVTFLKNILWKMGLL